MIILGQRSISTKGRKGISKIKDFRKNLNIDLNMMYEYLKQTNCHLTLIDKLNLCNN